MSARIQDIELERALDQLLDVIAANVEHQIREDTRLAPRNRIQALAEKTGLGKGTIQRLLGGSRGYANQAKQSPRVATLLRLAWWFDVPLISFFSARDRKSRVLGDLLPSPHEAVSEREMKTRRR